MSKAEPKHADPAADQTEMSIGDYLRRCKVGDEVVIHETHGGSLRLALTNIEGISPKKGRLYTRDGGYGGTSWYIRTGRNCWFPKGQSHLVEPTAAVRVFIAEHSPDGIAAFTEGVELYGTDTPAGITARDRQEEFLERVSLRVLSKAPKQSGAILDEVALTLQRNRRKWRQRSR